MKHPLDDALPPDAGAHNQPHQQITLTIKAEYQKMAVQRFQQLDLAEVGFVYDTETKRLEINPIDTSTLLEGDEVDQLFAFLLACAVSARQQPAGPDDQHDDQKG